MHDGRSEMRELHDKLPAMPPRNKNGNYPLSAGLVVLARTIIKDRESAGLSQKELAEAAGIRPETLNRIEKGKTNPDRSTIQKIDAALKKVTKKAK